MRLGHVTMSERRGGPKKKDSSKGPFQRRRKSNARKSVSQASEAPGDDVEEEKSDECEDATQISAKECKHLRVRRSTGICANCKTQVPQFGSVFDTGTVQAFIKVIYIDESKGPSAVAALNSTNGIKPSLASPKDTA